MNNHSHRRDYYQSTNNDHHSYGNYYTPRSSAPAEYQQQSNVFRADAMYVPNYGGMPRFNSVYHYGPGEYYSNGYQEQQYHPQQIRPTFESQRLNDFVGTGSNNDIPIVETPINASKSLQATAPCFVPKNNGDGSNQQEEFNKKPVGNSDQIEQQTNGARSREKKGNKEPVKRVNSKKQNDRKQLYRNRKEKEYEQNNESFQQGYYSNGRRSRPNIDDSRLEWRRSNDYKPNYTNSDYPNERDYSNNTIHSQLKKDGYKNGNHSARNGSTSSYKTPVNFHSNKATNRHSNYNPKKNPDIATDTYTTPEQNMAIKNGQQVVPSITYQNRQINENKYPKYKNKMSKSNYKFNNGSRHEAKAQFQGKSNAFGDTGIDKSDSEKCNLIRTRKKLNSVSIADQDDKTQRETLIELLTQGTYECMVCCDRIKPVQAIWSCNKCYNCFHMGCTKKWAGTSQGDAGQGWRCPACQNLNAKMPNGYFCFCKKLREPEWNIREIPHSCGDVCGKKRHNEWCKHKCTSLCHPGPCLECSAFINRKCRCGKSSREMKCSTIDPYVCGENCDKYLDCEIHKCIQKCHVDDCQPCDEMLDKECFCGKEKMDMKCTKENAQEQNFSCDSICGKDLTCGNHTCNQVCHTGICSSCDKAVDVVIRCPCGKTILEQYFKENNLPSRSSCSDPIPTCKSVCGKMFKCGTPGDYHRCQSLCHVGQCPSCPNETAVKCRCGFMDKNIPCSELLTKADEILCGKQCKKLRQCGRHKCGLKCCIDVDHLCSRICEKTLKCRLHKCEEPCHRGNCPRCWETSFDELTCHCGSSVTYPPIPCGTEPPACNLPCRREQSCSHPSSHTCHSEPKCPPCTILLSKPCFGNHMVMNSTPCYVKARSCGEQCSKVLPCGIHKCLKVCHNGSCTKVAKCNQKCIERRNSCEHPCNNPCHSGPCPNTSCKENVSVTCECGNRKAVMACSDNDREYKSLATSKLASVMHNMNSGCSVDISQIFSGSQTNKIEKFKRLDCNDDCGLIQRNRRLALALQIANPFARESLGDNDLYSETLKEDAKRDVTFAQSVHDILNQLVLKAKESKQKNRSYSFPPMNRDKRRFIHEYAKLFSCQSQSYDEEPKKNVVVTACKLLSQLPPVSIVTVIQRELGTRRVVGPVLPRKINPSEESSSSLKKLEKSSSFEKKEPSPTNDSKPSTNTSVVETVIDYFDFS